MSKPLAQHLRSALFDCTVWHARSVPRRHQFRYRLFFLALDLDELPQLRGRLRWLGINQPGVMSFWERDYLPVPAITADASDSGTSGGALKGRVLAWCAAQGVDLPPDVRVSLVTLPRILGYAFNPVSFYFCLARDGRPLAAIAEVTNTFHEVKPYLILPRNSAEGAAVFEARVAKHFYVSPFSGLDVAFAFSLRVPDERLAIAIDDYDGTVRTLHSTVTGRRHALNDARLAWCFFRYPLVTGRVIARIHWEALRLWAKRIPFHRKADNPSRQRNLLRPHASLAARVS